MYFLYSALTSVVQTVAWLLFYMWCALLVYNYFNSALHQIAGVCQTKVTVECSERFGTKQS